MTAAAPGRCVPRSPRCAAAAPRGFTLLEVLVALAVVALALLALTRTASLGVRDFDGLRERSLAGWVAANVLAETRLATPLPAPGRSDGQVEMAGRRWYWTRDIQPTPNTRIRRVDIGVATQRGGVASASITGFAEAAP